MIDNNQHPIDFLLILMFGGICLPSCMLLPKEQHTASSEKIKESAQISEEDLRIYLNDFGELFTRTIESTSREIAKQSENKKMKKRAVLWKLRVIPSIQAALYRENSILCLIDAGIYCLQMRHFFQSGDPDFFGKWQPLAISASDRVIKEISRIGHRLSPRFPEAEKEMIEFARQHPFTGLFVGDSIRTVLGSRKEDFEENETTKAIFFILNLPLIPFRSLEGISVAANALKDFNSINERFVQIVERIPHRLRGEMELLLYQLDKYESIIQALDGLEKISESSLRFSKTAEQLPALPREIRKEVTLLAQEIESKQEKINQTLSKLAYASQAVDDAGDSLGGTLATFNRTLEMLNVPEEIEEENENEVEEDSFRVEDYTAAFLQLQKTSHSLQVLLQEFQKTLESQDLEKRVDRLTTQVTQRSVRSSKEVINHAGKWLLGLLLGFLVGIWIYKLI